MKIYGWKFFAADYIGPNKGEPEVWAAIAECLDTCHSWSMMRLTPKKNPFLCVIALLASLVAGTLSLAANATEKPLAVPDERGKISMDFQNVSIHVLIRFIGELTGKNFIVDKGVMGRVSVYSPTPVSLPEAFEVFSSVLQVNGFAMVSSGKVIKIIPVALAKGQSPSTVTSRKTLGRKRGDYVTQIVPIEYASVADIQKALTPLVGPGGNISYYLPANTLILSDYSSNIEYLLGVIRQLDKDLYGKKFMVYRLKYGKASDVAEKVSRILRDGQRNTPPGGVGPTVVSDDRTNTVIVAASPEDRKAVDSLVTALDVVTPRGKGDVHLVYLENADAEDAAKVLMELVQQGTGGENAKLVFSRDVKVVADKATNSLVISAAPTEYELLRQTIRQLDVERKQVFVEALIMEISTDKTFSFGVNWATASKVGDGVLFGGSQVGGGQMSTDSSGNASLPSGGSIGYVKFPISIGDITFNNLQAIINFSQSSSEFRVLSTPQLLTLDNEEAKVVVAENIPYSTQINSGEAVTDKTTQSFDYRDVGVILTMTPQIGEKGTVKLKLNQQVSKVVDSRVTSENNDYFVLAPTTRRREVDTSVLIRDGETIVIAGLMDRDKQETESKIPVLGDIPLLGNLFKYKEMKDKQKNLLIFLTPKIVDSEEDVDELYREKRVYLTGVEIGEDGVGLPAFSDSELAPAWGVAQ